MRRSVILGSIALALVAGERSDWNRIQQNPTRAELEAFRLHYPRSRHDAEAGRMLGRLQWAEVDKRNNESVRQFLLSHLDDPYFADEMRKDISRSGLTVADKPWESFEGQGEEADRLRSFVVKYRGAEASRKEASDAARIALDRLVAAYESKALDGVRLVWPMIPDAVLSEYRERFASRSGVRMSFTVFEETSDGTRTDLVAEQAWFSASGAQRRLVKVTLRQTPSEATIEQIAEFNPPSAASSGSR